jgi:hydroxyethylthiazole kinase-like uncharacterized protein yjeF
MIVRRTNMIPVLTASQMREADRRTIEEIGLPGVVLMENAGAAVAAAIAERFPRAKRAAILCGRGNNGGDGFVVARRLQSLRPAVYLIGTRGDVKGDARVHLGALERSGVGVVEVVDEVGWQAVRDRLWEADLIVDALLGTGLSREVEGLVRRVIEDVNALRERHPVPLVAVDLPSGVASDTGEVLGPALAATVTVTFAAPKHGQVLPPACDLTGELLVADIGIPRDLLDSTTRLWLLEGADACGAFAPRAPGAHKGDFGHLLVIAGCVGKSGAAVLAATSALRSGVGLVTVATAAGALPMVAEKRAEVMTEPLAATAAGSIAATAVDRALALAAERDAVVLGPGLGQEAETRAFVREFVRRCASPLLIDADGLNALAPAADAPGAIDLLRRPHATVVTPHPGEMARLLGSSARDVQKRRLETARTLAVETGAVVVLKGQRTLVCEASGRAAVNPTGNAGMATAGTGDVLTGVIGALVARGGSAWLSATTGVYLHGLAGDIAARRFGVESLMAGDLVDALAEAIATVDGRDARDAR